MDSMSTRPRFTCVTDICMNVSAPDVDILREVDRIADARLKRITICLITIYGIKDCCR